MEWRMTTDQTRWNGEDPEGTEDDQMERRGSRWNEGDPDGTKRIQMERRGTICDGQVMLSGWCDGTEGHKMKPKETI